MLWNPIPSSWVWGWSWHSYPGHSPELGLLPPPQALFGMHIRYRCPLQNCYLYRNLREDEGGRLLPPFPPSSHFHWQGPAGKCPPPALSLTTPETCSFPSSPRGPCWEFLLSRKSWALELPPTCWGLSTSALPPHFPSPELSAALHLLPNLESRWL